MALSVATAAPTALAASRSRAMRQALLRPASAAAPPARPRKLVAAAAAVSVDAFTPPVLVLGAAALGLAQPALFSSLGPAAIAPALAVGSLATGLTIKAEVRLGVERMYHLVCSRSHAAALIAGSQRFTGTPKSPVLSSNAAHQWAPQDVKRMLSSPAGSLPPLAVRFAALPLVALAMTKAAGLEPAVAVG